MLFLFKSTPQGSCCYSYGDAAMFLLQVCENSTTAFLLQYVSTEIIGKDSDATHSLMEGHVKAISMHNQ